MESLLLLYKEYAREEAARCEALTGSGSNRRYYRLTGSDGHTLIGVVGTSREENHAFLYLARHFAGKGLPVPKVLATSHDEMRYLQDDLGSRSLFDALKHGREAGGQYNDEERELLRRTIRLLPQIQMRGNEGLDYAQCYPQAEMDRTNVMFDLNYFKYCFLKTTDIDFHEMRLEADFQQMADDLTSEATPKGFLYRDFQARNVMLDDRGNPHFIDFQGGRRGPVHYDVASFLWQASARYPAELREELLAEYMDALRPFTEVDEQTFRRRLRLFVLFRLLQVLGAYGFRGRFERKQHFIDSIPPALDNVRSLLAEAPIPYPHLAEVLDSLVNHPTKPLKDPKDLKAPKAPKDIKDPKGTPSPLTVRVFSFSYKRGIPEDESGNGGGYVFDCRSTHNPGRYEPYKQLTGLDEAVIRFLEDDGEILTFLQSVYRLADAHVERYIERGFTSLMFSFGCTGGQHRSVYSAQHLAEHLHQKYGIRVELCHREQGIRQTFPPLRP
ncbi:MAG: phosphotransferase [Bacteroidaceae bacterium]|nr:phosphotransferase [Bacteroidaceae bacterium]